MCRLPIPVHAVQLAGRIPVPACAIHAIPVLRVRGAQNSRAHAGEVEMQQRADGNPSSKLEIGLRAAW